jgi:hypothetical protein
MAVLAGILGTTISPYLFFRQASQEVDEDRKHGKTTSAQRGGSTNQELAGPGATSIGECGIEPRHVFHHSHDCRDFARSWLAEYRYGETGLRGTPAVSRPGAYRLFTLGLIGMISVSYWTETSRTVFGQLTLDRHSTN